MITGKNANYDSLAWFYDRYWGEEYHKLVLPIMDELLFLRLPAGARVLDLCCGTGHLTQALADRGFKMTGIDSSAEMLGYAKKNVPTGKFFAMDARDFKVGGEFDAVISTFESLNHIMTLGDMASVFRNVKGSLVKGGYFIFDLILEEAYLASWDKSSTRVEEDNVCIIRGGFDTKEKVGRTEITMFRLKEEWERADVELLQKCYHPEDISCALIQTGYEDIRIYNALKDFGMPGDLGFGRAFFLAKNPNK